jgi:hypothetical protein
MSSLEESVEEKLEKSVRAQARRASHVTCGTKVNAVVRAEALRERWEPA